MAPGRNAPCPCGSTKKYKQCCGGFDLTAQHFLLLLDVMGVASRRARQVQQAIAAWDMDEAFPMRIHLPLLLTVWAQVTCTEYRRLDKRSLPDGWLSVPKDYERKVADVEAVLMPSAEGKEKESWWWSF